MPSSCGPAGETTTDSIEDAPPSTESLLDSDDSPGQLGDFLHEEIVHKSIWNDSRRTPEGVTLKRFPGAFGVCQLIGHRDNVYSTRIKYPDRLRKSPAAFPSRLSNVSDLLSNQTSNTTDTDGETSTTDISQAEESTPSSETSEEAQDSDGIEDAQKPPLREERVKSDILMPKGRSLFEARNPVHLLRALHDALLGIAAFAEVGMLHRDISVYNILLVDPKVHYRQSGGWMNAVSGLGSLVWNSLASEILPPKRNDEPGATPTTDEKSYREEYLRGLNRGPAGVVSDVEFSVEERRDEEEVNTDRTGTPAFISAQLLESFTTDQPPVAHTIIHDIESVLWVLVWVVAHHEPGAMNPAAKDFARSLSEPNLRKLYHFKQGTIESYDSLERNIRRFDNGWSEDLAPVIQELAIFLSFFMYVRKGRTTLAEALFKRLD
ncbi:kinase domain protein [Ceratobasidium sp. AG-Ba]|nr:kinase domain protein [Ceratobasidium sp. AG-Ba]